MFIYIYMIPPGGRSISLSARTMMLMKFEVFQFVLFWAGLFFYCHKLQERPFPFHRKKINLIPSFFLRKHTTIYCKN